MSKFDLWSGTAALRQRNDLLMQRISATEHGHDPFAHPDHGETGIDGLTTADRPCAAQDRLRRSDALFRALIEKSAEIISLTAADGVTRYLTPSAWQMLGWTEAEMGTRALRDQVLPEDRVHVANELDRLVRSGKRDMTTEFRARHRDGSIRWIELTGTNLLDDPDVRAIVGNYRDVTVQKEAQEALREGRHLVEALRASEERYRRIVETTCDGIWIYDADYVTTFMSARMAQMLCCTVTEAVGQPVYRFMDGPGRDDAASRVARRKMKAFERATFCFLRGDGTELWASVQGAPMLDSRGMFEAGLAVVTDISAQRGAEEVRARLAAIVESSEDAIMSVSLDGTICTWNLGAEKLYRFAAGAVAGKPADMLVSPSARDNESRVLDRVARGETVPQYETAHVRADGSVVEVAVTVSPVLDAEGTVTAVSKIVRDLTSRQLTETALRNSEEQFRQAQKMEAVGRLAGGVAHDFNNLLSVILSYAELGQGDLKEGDPLRADLAEIYVAGKRATELTRQLLAFSRQQVLQPRVINLSQIVAGMDSMLRRLIGEDIALIIRTSNDLGQVLADPGQIEQVVMNLAVNARDAMPDGGNLTIETTNVELDAFSLTMLPTLAPGSYAMLSVSDSGSGMDAATRERIFEPFFTTKEKGGGTGLGLSTVFGIVEQSGGQVVVDSAPGRGSAFKVYLPRTDRAADTPLAENFPRTTRGSETILLVEDEEQVRAVASVILRRNGYRVLETSNGGEAMLVSKDCPTAIELLLTDVVLPRMNGRKLAEELAASRPQMKVLFASGYTDDAVVLRDVLESGVPFLQKPFTPDGLLRKVRAVLDRATHVEPTAWSRARTPIAGGP